MNKDSLRLLEQLREEITVLKDRAALLESYVNRLQESLVREDREAAEAVDLSDVSFEALPEEEVSLPEVEVDLPAPEPVKDPHVAVAPQDDKAAVAPQDDRGAAVPQDDKAAVAPQDDRGAAVPQDDSPVIPSEAKESIPAPELPVGNFAWRKDLPGLPVRDIRSAISLNDRVLFINGLFQQDALRFQDVLNALNGLEQFSDAERYLRANFPQWNYESDIVYRFMMAVRRKLR